MNHGQLSEFVKHFSAASFLSLVFLASILVIVWTYWPGLEGGHILDDAGSVQPLAMLREQPEALWDTVQGELSGPLGRPISTLTFALEYAFLDGDVAVLKRHSILLHTLNFVLACYLLQVLFSARTGSSSTIIALAGATLWALAPQQTSTVLYAVQRMAMLSAFFVLLALIAYLKWRNLSHPKLVRSCWAIVCVACVLAAPFAKENGVVAIPLIMVLELLWFRPPAVLFKELRPKRRLATYGLIGAVFLTLCMVFWNLETLRASYVTRSFTLDERFLSQPRALLDYARQFYWPNLNLLGVYHDDFAVGTPGSFFRDVLLASFVLLCGLACFVSVFTGVFSGLAFAVLAYLAAHSLESSVLALEPYFEHRNYLPSVFLALIPALALDRARQTDWRLLGPLVAWTYVLILFLTLQTSSQVKIWSRDLLLAVHHLHGHPDSMRANADLATKSAMLGDYVLAEELSMKAHQLSLTIKAARVERESDLWLRNIALACMAGVEAPQRALDQLGVSDSDRPLSDPQGVEVIVRLVRVDSCPGFDWDSLAEKLAVIYLKDKASSRASSAMFRSLSTFSYQLFRNEEADEYALLALELTPDDPWLLLMRLQYAAELGRMNQMYLLKERLSVLRDAGGLNVAQRQTLEMYEKP
ncbi:hypothetical protein N9H37_00990 [Congregibacter sp.]|nr:hypothetical protein [Congregibacter sp.]MDA8961916.1 hypothetical protein [Congregibacter sp.]